MASEPTSAGHGQARPGIPGSELPGPFPVGEYAEKLRLRLREFARVQLVGEVVNLRPPTRARVYFELRDAHGALPCAMWRDAWEALGPALASELVDGAEVIVAGGCDYYAGSATSSPSFSFQVADLRIAGEGELLARIARLRRKLAAEGLLDPQQQLPRPALPRTIGVVTGEGGKARDDLLAALRRRGWGGRLVWAFAPVQDRHAAPRITRALQELAAQPEVEVVVVARGGGSLTDLMAFSDETLCRTVALLRVPVIASVGHHGDRTVLDDVAAVSASTPTHAAEAAVPLDVGEARRALRASAAGLAAHARRAVVERARLLARQARAPAEHIARERRRRHQQLRELRASARRRLAGERALTERRLLVVGRKAAVARGAVRRRELEHLRLALDAHDPERTLARGYALITDRRDEPVTSAAEARRRRELRLRFADDAVDATTTEQP